MSLDPENVDHRAGHGAALAVLRRYREAMADFDYVMGRSPGYFENEDVKEYFDRARLALRKERDG